MRRKVRGAIVGRNIAAASYGRLPRSENARSNAVQRRTLPRRHRLRRRTRRALAAARSPRRKPRSAAATDTRATQSEARTRHRNRRKRAITRTACAARRRAFLRCDRRSIVHDRRQKAGFFELRLHFAIALHCRQIVGRAPCNAGGAGAAGQCCNRSFQPDPGARRGRYPARAARRRAHRRPRKKRPLAVARP